MSHAAAIARLTDAKTILLRASLSLNEGETKARVTIAVAAVSDALEECHSEMTIARTLKNLEVIADALAAPGTSEAA